MGYLFFGFLLWELFYFWIPMFKFNFSKTKLKIFLLFQNSVWLADGVYSLVYPQNELVGSVLSVPWDCYCSYKLDYPIGGVFISKATINWGFQSGSPWAEKSIMVRNSTYVPMYVLCFQPQYFVLIQKQNLCIKKIIISTSGSEINSLIGF